MPPKDKEETLLRLSPASNPPEPSKTTSTFSGFFTDPGKFKSFLNQKIEVSDKGDHAGFLNSGNKGESEESDEEEKDNLAAPSELPELDVKIAPLATSPYTKILSVAIEMYCVDGSAEV